MTHPNLGWANLRFDGSDLVHMAATPTARHTVACDVAATEHEHAVWPHEVDAQITCAVCLHARELDRIMAEMEHARRNGESVYWPVDEVEQRLTGVMERLASQADATAEEAIIGGPVGREQFLGLIDWAASVTTNAPQDGVVDIAVTSGADFRDDTATVTITGAPQDIATVADHIIPAMADDVTELMAQRLAKARSPLVDLRRAQRPDPQVTLYAALDIDDKGNITGFHNQTTPPTEEQKAAERDAVMRSMATIQPPYDDGPDDETGISTSVHAAIERAQQELAEHPFGKYPDWRRLLRHAEVINADEDTPVSEPYGLYYHKEFPGKAVRYNNNLVPDVSMGELSAKLYAFLANGAHDCEASSCAGQTFDPPCGACCSCLGGCCYAGPGEPQSNDIDMACQRCNHDTHRCPGCGTPLSHGVEVCEQCNAEVGRYQATPEAHRQMAAAMYPYFSGGKNWCHVHNRATEPEREQCMECDGEQGEARSACDPNCEHGS